MELSMSLKSRRGFLKQAGVALGSLAILPARETIVVKGFHEEGDGGGGLWEYDSPILNQDQFIIEANKGRSTYLNVELDRSLVFRKGWEIHNCHFKATKNFPNNEPLVKIPTIKGDGHGGSLVYCRFEGP